MNAIEFETDYKNGVIEIPKDYKINNNSHLKVIILYDTESKKNDSKNLLIDITTRYKNLKENDLDIKKIYINRNENEDRKISFD